VTTTTFSPGSAPAFSLDTDDTALQEVVRRVVVDRGAAAAARAVVDLAPDATERESAWWRTCADQGWWGLHVPEPAGGSGAGLVQTAVVLFELARVVAPGPALPTLVASAVLAEEPGRWPELLEGLADGSLTAGLGLGGALVRDGGTVSGDAGVVLGSAEAAQLLLAVGDDLVLVGAAEPGLELAAATGVDRTQPLLAARLQDVPASVLPGRRPHALAVLRTLAAVQAAGIADAALTAAVEYARIREQFGRPIGAFQAVKHLCADLVVDAELALAVAWDAARALTAGPGPEAELAAATAAAVALPRALAAAETSLHVHGAIGFTWEHDAHLLLRRALALQALVPPAAAAADVVRLRLSGTAFRVHVDLPDEVEPVRAEARELARRLAGRSPDEQRAGLVAAGYALPQLPPPWGRGYGPAAQLAADAELAGLARPDYGVGAWVIPTLVQHGTPEQLERWIGPSVRGELRWCQMFSEPGAGSDAAAIATRAVPVEGGWRLYGQKVWTSRATTCNRGLATVRTSSDGPKQAGITMVVVDLDGEGVEVRPLREASDEYGFGEVFLDGYFVPHEDVVGPVGGGWAVARSTLGNERVTVGATAQFGGGVVDLLDVRRALGHDRADAEIGALLAERQAMDLLGVRAATRAVAGAPPGREGAITKLVRSAVTRRSAELAVRLLGPQVALADGAGAAAARSFVKSQMTAIGGGTTEIVKNLVAERLLGLPRDPR